MGRGAGLHPASRAPRRGVGSAGLPVLPAHRLPEVVAYSSQASFSRPRGGSPSALECLPKQAHPPPGGGGRHPTFFRVSFRTKKNTHMNAAQIHNANHCENERIVAKLRDYEQLVGGRGRAKLFIG
jgi:hypothetical protein